MNGFATAAGAAFTADLSLLDLEDCAAVLEFAFPLADEARLGVALLPPAAALLPPVLLLPRAPWRSSSLADASASSRPSDPSSSSSSSSSSCTFSWRLSCGPVLNARPHPARGHVCVLGRCVAEWDLSARAVREVFGQLGQGNGSTLAAAAVTPDEAAGRAKLDLRSLPASSSSVSVAEEMLITLRAGDAGRAERGAAEGAAAAAGFAAAGGGASEVRDFLGAAPVLAAVAVWASVDLRLLLAFAPGPLPEPSVVAAAGVATADAAFTTGATGSAAGSAAAAAAAEAQEAAGPVDEGSDVTGIS